MDIENYLKTIVEKITHPFNPDKIILFGSYAYGQPTAHSGLDLMVVMDTDERPHKRTVSVRKVLKGIGMPKDIIVKTPEEFERFKDIVGPIVYPAAHKGRIIYEKQ